MKKRFVMVHYARVWAGWVLVALLAACGGGGGGGSAPTGASTQLTGTISYDAVPNVNGALNYAAQSSKPVRGVVVEAVDSAGDVLGSTVTGETGAYAMAVPVGQTLAVRVRAQLRRDGPGPNWDVSVLDNTQGYALYVMESPFFVAQAGGMARDVHAPSGWGGARYTGTRVAAPFAILDTVYTAMNKVLSVAPATGFPRLRLLWSGANLPSPGNVTLGQIGTSSFTRDSEGAAIYLLGRENVDTEEYDPSVIAHEWGHYYQWAFSRDDTPGGDHSLDDLLDLRLAFSEGWGNAWSGMALDSARYTDSLGLRQAEVGADMDLRAGEASNPGWFREASVQSVLWRLNALHGFGPMHQALTGPLRTQRALTGIHAFAAAYVQVQPAARNDLTGLLAGQGISTLVDDPWATQEFNAGGVAVSVPLYHAGQRGVAQVVCVSNAAGGFNKLGNNAYVRYSLPGAGAYQVSVSGPAGSDPDIQVFAGGSMGTSLGLGTSETASFSLPAGDVVVALNDANEISSNTCLNVVLQ